MGPQDLEFNNDGSKLFVVGSNNRNVYEYTLTTNYDVTSANFSQSYSVNSQETNPTGLAFSNDGNSMFVVGPNGDNVITYTLTSAFDVSTVSSNSSFSVSSQESDPRDVAFNNDGTKMYIVGNSGNDIVEYDVGTAIFIKGQSFG